LHRETSLVFFSLAGAIGGKRDGDRAGEATTLVGIGAIYNALGRPQMWENEADFPWQKPYYWSAFIYKM